MSDVTSVPATPLKVSFGSMIAPKNSALAARCHLTLSSFLSIVPEDVCHIPSPITSQWNDICSMNLLIC